MMALGYLRDLPDDRDYSIDRETVSPALAALGQKPVAEMLRDLGVTVFTSTPPQVDLRQWCSPVHDQQTLQSCTAHAATNLLEFYERKGFGKHLEASRLFLYWATRRLLGWHDRDTGAYLRTTMAAMRLFGVPPERWYPYDPARVNQEPPAWTFPLAENFQAVQYFRLDAGWLDRLVLLRRIKVFLAARLPVMFGFTVYENISDAAKSGFIPLPAGAVVGGHAVLAVGYDDRQEALLIQNSWGEGWGDGGFGWLPYAYVTRGLAVDWWTLLRAEWVDTGEFGL